MKRRLLSLLLILALCLGLCACGGDLKKDQITAACGVWYLREYDNKENNPGYFELKEDGTGSFLGKTPFTWSGQQDGENKSHLALTLLMENEQTYALDLYLGNPNYPEARLTLQTDGPSCSYQKASLSVGQTWLGEISTQWFVRDENATVQTVNLNGDGTVLLDGEAYFWSADHGWDENENRIYLDIYNEKGAFGTLEAYRRSNGLYDFHLYDGAKGRGYSYYNHPMLDMLDDGTWESFDRFTMIDDYIYVSPWYEMVTVGEQEYTTHFDVSTSQETLTITFQHEDLIRYVAEVFMDVEYPMIMMTDQQTGHQTLYFNNHYGYSPDNIDAQYFKTLNLVYRYVNDYSVYTLETDEQLDQYESLPYIYEKLVALEGHKQSQEFLDRFTIVPSKLTEVIQYDTDWSDNVQQTCLGRYEYDEKGAMIWGQGERIVEKFGLYDTDIQYFTYDSKGKIAQIHLGAETPYAVGKPIFDTAGKVVGMSVQRQDSDYTSVFTYGAQGRVLRLEIPEAERGETTKYEYEYDDAGRVITKVKTAHDGYMIETYDYTYEGDLLKQIRMTHREWGNNYTLVYLFSCDEYGRPAFAEITTNTSDESYQSQKLVFTYRDLYFFDTTGLVPEEN